MEKMRKRDGSEQVGVRQVGRRLGGRGGGDT